MADPHHTGPAGDSPLTQLMVSMSGASPPEHETEPPGASPDSLRAGHEPDRFNVRGILYVPLFVVVVVGIAYVLVSSVFAGFVKKDDPGKAKNEHGAKQNQADISDRFGRISYTKPKALEGMPDTAVPQPRLEGLKQQGHDGPGNDPPHIRSKRPVGENNSPEYRPEDLRPENFTDPDRGRRVLAEYHVEGPAKSVPIDVAMRAVTAPGKLPTKKGPDGKPVEGPPPTSDGKAKPSNSGFGPPAEAAPKADGKHDDHGDEKKGNEKKDEKKGNEKK